MLIGRGEATKGARVGGNRGRRVWVSIKGWEEEWGEGTSGKVEGVEIKESGKGEHRSGWKISGIAETGR